MVERKGTNVLIKERRQIISGLRQVAGVYGHGNQIPEIDIGCLRRRRNDDEVEPELLDPTDGIRRLLATAIAQPSTIAGTNHYSLTTTDAEASEDKPLMQKRLRLVPSSEQFRTIQFI